MPGDGESEYLVLYTRRTTLLNQLRDKPGPPCLVAGTQPGPVIAVEVLVEEDMVAEMRILLEQLYIAVDRPPPCFVPREQPRQELREMPRDFPEGHGDYLTGTDTPS